MIRQASASTNFIAVSPSDPEQSRSMIANIREKYGSDTDFPFLSDIGHKVIDRYGILNDQGRGNIPHPALYVADKTGKVVYRFIEKDYKVRAPHSAILAALETAN